MTIERRVAISEGITVQLDGTMLTVVGPKGQLQRNMRFPQIDIAIEENEIAVRTDSSRKKTIAMVGTIESHTKNMIRGVSEGYEYRMKVVYSHFPIQLKLQQDRLEINNFLGEKQPRIAKIMEGVSVNLGNDEVVVTGINKELVGNTSANIENATRIKKLDPRVFQDGIYIVEKV